MIITEKVVLQLLLECCLCRSSFLCGKEVLWLFSWCVALSFLLLLLGFRSFLIEFHELGKIKLGFLEDLNLLDHDVLEGEDLSTFLLDLFANGLGNEFLAQFLKSGLLSLSNHDLHHSLPNGLLLGALGIASGLDLFASPPGKPNAEHSEHVPISSLGLHKRLNGGVPFLHKLAELVLGNIHAMEVSVAIVTLYFLNLHLHFSPVFIVAFVL